MSLDPDPTSTRIAEPDLEANFSFPKFKICNKENRIFAAKYFF